MFIKIHDDEAGNIYVNSNMVTEIFCFEDQWYIRDTHADEFEIDEETKNKLVGETGEKNGQRGNARNKARNTRNNKGTREESGESNTRTDDNK